MLSLLARTFSVATRMDTRERRPILPSQDWPTADWRPEWPAPLHWYQRPQGPQD